MNNIPYLPTEIWDKIFDIKYSIEIKEDMKKHNDYHKDLLKEMRSKRESFYCFGYVDFHEWFFECLDNDEFDINIMSILEFF
tara:strand:+ start:2880 stop:3125 length:246 start_codon:yes stop_codon:yes gene_type:complete